MLIWLQHKDHGRHPVYNDIQLDICLKHGWERMPEEAEVIPLMNETISPKKTLTPKQALAQREANKRCQAKKKALKDEHSK
jgi:hypothetical protein